MFSRYGSPLMYLKYCLGFAGLGVLCLGWTPVALLLNVLLPKHRCRRLGRQVIAAGFRAYLDYLAALRAVRADLSALDALRDAGPLILAPNHPCLLDAVMILSRLPNATCIVKAPLFDSVFFGAGARMAGYIRNDMLIGVVKDASAALKGGSQLLMFPEGTRTENPPLDPCKGGLALVAARAQKPVQVLLIEADTDFLGKRWSFFRHTQLPARYRITLGERFDPPKEATAFLPQLEASLRASLGRAAAEASAVTINALIAPAAVAPAPGIPS